MGQRISRGGKHGKLFSPEYGSSKEISADDFEVLEEIGKGSFGRVSDAQLASSCLLAS